jgi:hypothetical protein
MTCHIKNGAFRPGYRVFPGDIVISSPNGVELSRIAAEKVFRFGKWENCRVGFGWEKDPGYLAWIAQQSWFLEKHKRLVTAIKSIGDFDVVVARTELGWEDYPETIEDARRARARREKRREMAVRPPLSQPENPPPPRASRDVTVLAGGCAVIRPAVWAARATTQKARVIHA